MQKPALLKSNLSVHVLDIL